MKVVKPNQHTNINPVAEILESSKQLFSIGDRVKVLTVDSIDRGFGVMVGYEGTIMHIIYDFYKVKWDKPTTPAITAIRQNQVEKI